MNDTAIQVGVGGVSAGLLVWTAVLAARGDALAISVAEGGVLCVVVVSMGYALYSLIGWALGSKS